jgi:hypothetical protein
MCRRVRDQQQSEVVSMHFGSLNRLLATPHMALVPILAFINPMLLRCLMVLANEPLVWPDGYVAVPFGQRALFTPFGYLSAGVTWLIRARC